MSGPQQCRGNGDCVQRYRCHRYPVREWQAAKGLKTRVANPISERSTGFRDYDFRSRRPKTLKLALSSPTSLGSILPGIEPEGAKPQSLAPNRR
jgi:hypothetical protein